MGVNDKHGFFKHNPSQTSYPVAQSNVTIRDQTVFSKSTNDKNGLLPPKHPKQKIRGRNGQTHPYNTFGVSREEREKVLSYKIVSPPTGLYNVKFNMCDPNDKVTKLVPTNSSPERDPRFDYNKTNTLMWLPHVRDIENYQV